ncbi:hypothetical protein [Limimaricola pyoseonensis]|uniref:DUF7742 domain-containing protein n=1 Tax=Limimaricola pyoseonensis TaxID=521013 RepID=A0A1G7AWD9_9RHOB|nr:hypothetical protein [Limimaricola pyoseonensis]SDE19032.1 hypothetical protein SAMN04488567_1134 [Limimaricola pyoseonensis]
MRPVLPGCLDRGTAALLAVPGPARAGLARRLVAEARAADKWRLRMGKAHPLWGDGSLMAAALRHPRVALPPSLGREGRAALRLLLDALDEAGGL